VEGRVTGRAAGSLAAGVGYLLDRQRDDGSFCDYESMPIGAATQWVTGFVAAALADAAPGATDAIGRAAQWLVTARDEAGWGFNASVGPDADSTAWAMQTLRAAGLPVPPAAAAFVRGLQRRDGGFATYPRADGWGCSHPDVTPVAVLALDRSDRAAVIDRAVEYCLATMDPDTTWPAYWWRGRHYSTYWNRMLLAAAGRRSPPPRRGHGDDSRVVESAFDLAWVVALAALDGDPPDAVATLAELLADRQSDDGSWPGGADLRVTAPSCHRPWAVPIGERFRDDGNLIATASAVRALAVTIRST
jgi:Prenyltransferase and squalene oxidase repeat